MATRLSVVFRWFVRLGNLPACWRQANVTPIPKGPLSSSVTNSLPIFITSVLSPVFEHQVLRFVSNDLWNAVVCFNPPSLLIGKVWVPVMHYCASPNNCKVHWRVGRRLGSCRLISPRPLLGSSMDEFSISCALWLFDVLRCLYWHSLHQIDHSTLWWTVFGVNWLTLSGVPQGSLFGMYALYCW